MKWDVIEGGDWEEEEKVEEDGRECTSGQEGQQRQDEVRVQQQTVQGHPRTGGMYITERYGIWRS